MQDRAQTYDSPGGERSMASTVEAFNALTGHTLTEEQGWKFMACLKLARSEQGDYRADNFVDGAAYFGLAGEAAAQVNPVEPFDPVFGAAPVTPYEPAPQFKPGLHVGDRVDVVKAA